MNKTKEMIERETTLNAEWKDEGEEYYSMNANSTSVMFRYPLAYIALPKGHPDIKKNEEDLDPEVNGGLTFHEGNVFGWDYEHYQNDFRIEKHIKNALEYFKARGKKNENNK